MGRLCSGSEVGLTNRTDDQVDAPVVRTRWLQRAS